MIDVVAIDDDASICWLLGEVFALAGVSHRVTSSVAEAVACAGQERPAVAVVDISLGGANGIDVARQMRGLSPATEIIFLTGYSNGVTAKAGFPCTVIEKPFAIDRFTALVLKHIAYARVQG